MKRLVGGLTVAGLTLASSGVTTPPKYSPLHLAELVLQADVIVVGTITSADLPRVDRFSEERNEALFTLQVEEVLLGGNEGPTIVVRQFGDWACASRYAPYERGQRAIFHLQHARDAQGAIDLLAPFGVMGSGNEGECPATETSFFHQATEYWLEKRITYTVYGHEFLGLEVPKAEFVEAARGLRRCYAWDRDPADPRYFRNAGPRRTCDEAALELFKKSSPTAELLVNTAERILLRAR